MKKLQIKKTTLRWVVKGTLSALVVFVAILFSLDAVSNQQAEEISTALEGADVNAIVEEICDTAADCDDPLTKK